MMPGRSMPVCHSGCRPQRYRMARRRILTTSTMAEWRCAWAVK
ncbi:hypothetical protein RLOC_00007131 [Lonchura striata]|uniref:Uncharacterized protein n=1 Tax=Lonchura striata TaxID=40157 RepID=A0A218UIH0_9PASE|nr:hypothetical protein RLOC_00007131 [Lonchura striata domestica]